MAVNSKNDVDKIAQLIANHQADIQRIGINWGTLVNEKLDASEKKLLDALEKLLADFGTARIDAATFRKLKEIQEAVAGIRRGAFEDAREELNKLAVQLAGNDAKWAASLAAAISSATATADAGKIAFKQASDPAFKRIAKYGIFDGKTLREWFKKLSDDDLTRIISVVRSGVASGLTIQKIRQQIGGTAVRNYTDGILNITRTAAERLARTVASGVANEGKMAFYQANADIIKGVRFVDTLDGRVCPNCAPLGGTVYQLDEPKPSLPLHPNCRCVYVPVTELSDAISSSRPAANADFDAEAERLYKQKYPKDKYPKKDWKKLAASTREKYYYEAIRRYEDHTGKPAFSQVSGKMSFKEWFPTTSAEFQRDWLGPTRYKLYKTGDLSIDDFLAPYPNKRFTLEELKKRDIQAFKDAGLA